MEIHNIVILLVAGIISGAMNAVVGGGAFVAFPALIFTGLPPIQANATMTVSLWPGTLASLWAQRAELLKQTRLLPVFIPLSFIGGAIGAITVIHLSNQYFGMIVPYMLFAAAALFTWRGQLLSLVKNISINKHKTYVAYWFFAGLMQLLISIYIGFFGAGGGIMFLAFLAVIGIHNMHEANAARNCFAGCINSIATIIFIISGKIIWLDMVLMCTGAITGGYVCAHYARNLPSEWLRKVVIVIAWGMTAYFFWKNYNI